MRYRVDLSTGMLEKAKQNADNKELEIDFFHGDAENLPFEDNSFDAVTVAFGVPSMDSSAALLCC